MDYSQEGKKISIKVKRNSWLAAVFLVETLLCKAVSVFITIPYISVFGMIVVMFMLLLFNKRYNRRIIENLFSVFGILILILLFSGLRNGFKYVGTYLIYFLVFGTVAMFLMAVDIDYKTVLVAILKLSLIYIIIYFTFERRSFIASDSYWSNQMGLAYGFLTPVMAGMTGIWKRDMLKLNSIEKALSWFCMIVGIYIICIDCGTRGAMVAIAVSLVLLYIEKEKSFKKIFLILSIFVVVAIVLTNLETLLLFAHQILSDRGIDVPALTKMVWMLQRNIADNGRNEIYALSSRVFQESPILGHGVGYYESISGGAYTHNIFMELLCEVGLIGLLCMTLPMINNFIKVFFGEKIDKQENTMHMFLFFITIPHLMFSSSYWQLPAFWMYFWFVLRDMKIKRK